jgi:hypothetical protein
LGIAGARVASSSLDKITAEYLEHIGRASPRNRNITKTGAGYFDSDRCPRTSSCRAVCRRNSSSASC